MMSFSSTVNPYRRGSGVPDDEAANRARQHPRPRLLRPLLRASIHTHLLGQPAADDVREENSAPRQRTTAMHMTTPLFRPTINIHPLEQPAYDVGEERSTAGWWLDDIPTAEGGTFMYGNAGGGSSVPVPSRAGTYVYLPPGSEVYMAAGGARGGGPIQPLLQSYNPVGALLQRFRIAMDTMHEFHAHGGWLDIPTAEGGTFVYGNAGGGRSVPVPSRAGTYVYLPPGSEVYMAAGGARGGGPIQPLLQSYNPVGPLGTRAPQSSQDGVARHWALAVTDDFPTGDGEAPYLGGGALTVTDIFPPRDGGIPYLARGALPVTDVFPEIDGGTPHLARGALIPSVGDRGGANARNEHVIDMPPPLPNATTRTTDQARKFLERLLFGLLPACVAALGPLSGAPDGTKLAIYIIMAVLIVLILIGISTKAYPEHVARLATCAGIFAMTVFVSMLFSLGIYVVIAALVGVALCAITLAV